MKKIFENRGVLIAVLVILVVIVAVWLLVGSGGEMGDKNQEVAQGEPLEIALDFYETWLGAARSTSTDPYKEGLAEDPILSPELRSSLVASEDEVEREVDPVLCLPILPDQIATILVYELEDKAEVLIMSRKPSRDEQAIFRLTALKGGWYINEIKCSAGEVPPDREFTFETEGFLLKSVPPPFNSKNWHLIFEVDGVAGNVAPLIFDSSSMCTYLDGKKAVCDTTKFEEASKALVRGQMTETGVEVQQLEVLEKAEKE
ncbi:MAG: hypothetical protein Q8Q32_01780 [bacterium]|nr:hypothetical protein [bacterium]